MSRVGIARIAIFLCGVVVFSAVVTASPAHADRYRKSDAGGDMLLWRNRASAAPAHRQLDLRSVLVRHTRHFVMIQAVMSEVRRPRAGFFLLNGYLKVNRRAQPQEGGRAWAWSVEFNRHHPRRGTDFYVTNAVYLEQDDCYDFYTPGLRAYANYALDRVTVFIPRFCLAHLARPRWVRASVSTEDDTRAHRGYFDHLGRPQPRRPWPDFPLSRCYFTPRIRAG